MLDKGVVLKKKEAVTFLQTMGFHETVFSVRFRVKNGLKKAELDYWNSTLLQQCRFIEFFQCLMSVI